MLMAVFLKWNIKVTISRINLCPLSSANIESSSSTMAGASQVFRFLVGEDRREFTIHSALLTCQSPTLEALVSGKFKESTEFCVEWDDIDETTFTSFWQFVYTQDYHSRTVTATGMAPTGGSQATDIENSEYQPNEAAFFQDEDIAERERVDNDWYSNARSKKKKKKQRQTDPWDDFQLSCPSELPVHSLDHEVQETQVGVTTYADVLVHHARVYILADRYAITRLMNFSLRKLHDALMKLDLSESTVNDFIALLQLCYQELAPERLKQLAVHYAACHVKTLWTSKEFRELVEEGGSLSTALITSLLLRLD